MTSREPQEIEKDITNIDHALLTVSEIRSHLRHFVTLVQSEALVQSEDKNTSFVNLFTNRLNTIKGGLNKLSSEGENLKSTLEHAQVLAKENKFNWTLIKSEIEKEAAEEADRYQEEEANSRKAKEAGAGIKANAEIAYKELSSVVLERKPTTAPPIALFFTTFIEEWVNQYKPKDIDFTVTFVEKEQTTLTGSTCRIKICTHKALIAELELEHEKNSDTLIIHQYDIKGIKEEKHLWQDSQYLIFQKINLLATSAFEDMLVFFAKESLHNVLDWFSSYHDLFTQPCYRCSKLLQFDSPLYKYLPPVVRIWPKKVVTTGFETNHRHPATHQATGIASHMRCFTEYNNNHTI